MSEAETPQLRVAVAVNPAHPHSAVVADALIPMDGVSVDVMIVDRVRRAKDVPAQRGKLSLALVLRYIRGRLESSRSATESATEPNPLSTISAFNRRIVDLAVSGWEDVRDALAAVDLVVMAGFSSLVPDEALDAPRLGWVNLHPSLLPEYRGSHPLYWALWDCRDEVGITAYRVTSGLDTGPIVAQRRVSVAPNDTWRTLYSTVYEATPGLIDEVVTAARLARSRGADMDARDQREEDATFRPVPPRGHGRVDFTDPAEVIACRSRHMPGDQWFTYRGKTFLVLRAEALDESGDVGRVIRFEPAGAVIGTSKGALLLRELDCRDVYTRKAGPALRKVGARVGSCIADGSI